MRPISSPRQTSISLSAAKRTRNSASRSCAAISARSMAFRSSGSVACLAFRSRSGLLVQTSLISLKLEQRGSVKVFLFGGPDGVAETASQVLNAQSNGVTCVGTLYPGFGSVEEMSTDAIIDRYQ